MTKKRRKELDRDDAELTGEEMIEGFHFCWKQNLKPIGPKDKAWGDKKDCKCGYKIPTNIDLE